MLRILLFTLTNFAVLMVFTVVWTLLGIDQYLIAQGISVNIVSMLPFALVFGMGGSIISLLLSKTMAKRSTRAHVIEQPRNQIESWLLATVQKQAEQAGIGMPEVAVFDSPQPNAFATGANKNNALVAVSTGLLANMNRDEVEAVLAHEVSHVANGDMVTLTLIQGVLNTFVIIFSRLIGRALDQIVFKQRSGTGMGYFMMTILAQMVLGFLAQLIVMWFSRYREYRADEGGASLAGRQKMISALRRLQTREGSDDAVMLPKELAAFGLRGGSGLSKLLTTHPPLEQRIANLEQHGGSVVR